jgi:hypothetical protein
VISRRTLLGGLLPVGVAAATISPPKELAVSAAAQVVAGEVPTYFVSPSAPASASGAQFGPDTPGTTTSGIQEAFNALPTCQVFDAAGALVSGKAGSVQLLPGIFNTTTSITIPPGNITFEGPNTSEGAVQLSTYSPTLNDGGAIIVLTGISASQPAVVQVAVDSGGYPATSLIMGYMQLRAVSPPATLSTGSVLNLNGWWAGEVSHITALELHPAGNIANNLAFCVQIPQGALTSLKRYANIQTGGANIGHYITVDHIACENLSASFTGGSGFFMAGFDAGYYLLMGGPHQSFRNMAAFSCSYGIALLSGQYQPTVIDTFMWESCKHYLFTPYATNGAVVFRRPVLLGGVSPTTDIASTIGGSAPVLNAAAPRGLAVWSEDEFDPGGSPGIGVGRHMRCPGAIGTSMTTPGSPGQIGPFMFPCQLLCTAAGSASVVAYNGVKVGSSLAVNQMFSLKQGDYMTITWATTAPVFTIIPT